MSKIRYNGLHRPESCAKWCAHYTRKKKRLPTCSSQTHVCGRKLVFLSSDAELVSGPARSFPYTSTCLLNLED